MYVCIHVYILCAMQLLKGSSTKFLEHIKTSINKCECVRKYTCITH